MEIDSMITHKFKRDIIIEASRILWDRVVFMSFHIFFQLLCKKKIMHPHVDIFLDHNFDDMNKNMLSLSWSC